MTCNFSGKKKTKLVCNPALLVVPMHHDNYSRASGQIKSEAWSVQVRVIKTLLSVQIMQIFRQQRH